MDDLVSAVKLAQDASLESASGNSSVAVELYKKAIGILRDSYKDETDENMKKKIFNQMKVYLERAESIKKSSTNSRNSTTFDSPPPNYTNLIQPKPTRPIQSVSTSCNWSGIAGLSVAKGVLEEAILMPLKFPGVFTGRIRPWKSILLYGPPGTGKTLIARSCASECGIPFIPVSSADIMSKWQGESEKFIKNLFGTCPEQCIIFIDEIDSICGERSESDSESSKRVKTELLIQMQGELLDLDLFNSDKLAIVIAATNLPWALDSAVRRRFEKRIYIPLPDRATRREILEINLADIPNSITHPDYDMISERTEGFNASDMGILVRTGVMQSLKACKDATSFKVLSNGSYTPCREDDPGAIPMDFSSVPPNKLEPPILDAKVLMSALDSVSSSVDPNTLEKYDVWTKKFGSN